MKTLILLSFLIPFFSSDLSAEEEKPPMGFMELKEICAQKTRELVYTESFMTDAFEGHRLLQIDLKGARKKMDRARKLLVDAELGIMPKEQEEAMQEGQGEEDEPLSKDAMIWRYKVAVRNWLDENVELVDKLKADVEKTKAEMDRLTKKIGQARADLAQTGCEIPPEKTWALPSPEPAVPSGPVAESPSPYDPFTGNWSGTAKVTRSSDPKLVGLSSPYPLSISTKEGKLEIKDPTGQMGNPSAYKIKSEGSTLRIDYSGPSNLVVPQVTTTLTFTLNLTAVGDKLNGTISSTTRSDYEGPAGAGSSTLSVEMALHLERGK